MAPISTCDWAGRVAPSGLFQVPEEEIESCEQQLRHLGFDIPESMCCTDGGSAWPQMVANLVQVHVEDTFHNDAGVTRSWGMKGHAKNKFKDKKQSLLYTVMSVDSLTQLIEELKILVQGYDEPTRWIQRIEMNKERCCAMYTSKYFICSIKGATSRCKVSMS